MKGKNCDAADKNGDSCFCDCRILGRRNFGKCAGTGGADDADNSANARGYCSGYRGEQRKSTRCGSSAEGEEFAGVVETE